MAVNAINYYKEEVNFKNVLQEYLQQPHVHLTVSSHQTSPSINVYVHEITAHHCHLDSSNQQYIYP